MNGLIVNIGVVPAEQALGFPAESESHATKQPSGAKHLIVSLSDATTGQHIEDARVSAEIRDPKGTVQRKQLIRTKTAGRTDYSEVFVLGWSGAYRIRIRVERAGAKPVRADVAGPTSFPEIRGSRESTRSDRHGAESGQVHRLSHLLGHLQELWTSRPGVEYAWFNNVETKPGIGYPKEWENQDKWHGGGGP